MKKILIATDLTARSDRALQRAVSLAKDFGAELKIVHVVDGTLPEAIVRQHEAAATTAIDDQLRSLQVAKNGLVSTAVIRGLDFVDILQAASDFGAELVVLGIHRHNTREMFRGTTAERVVRHGSHPVLVVKDAVVASYRRALVPVDLSPQSQSAIAMAGRLVPGGEVHLIHATHRPYTAFLGRDTQNQLIRDERARVAGELDRQVQEVAAKLGGEAPRFMTLLREGDVHRMIREQVLSIRPDLLVVGTHGRTGIAHAIIGSVAEDLLAEAPVDVLAVKS